MKEETDIPRGWSLKEVEVEIDRELSRAAAQELVEEDLSRFPEGTEFELEQHYDGASLIVRYPETDEEYVARVKRVRSEQKQRKERRRALFLKMKEGFADETG